MMAVCHWVKRGLRKGAIEMCLAIPARVVEISDGDNAVVNLGGVKKEISLALVEGVAVGDYVIVHVGYALNKLDPEEAEKTLALFAEMGAAAAT
jgi:hydrogenase expression/formation protein HypC